MTPNNIIFMPLQNLIERFFSVNFNFSAKKERFRVACYEMYLLAPAGWEWDYVFKNLLKGMNEIKLRKKIATMSFIFPILIGFILFVNPLSSHAIYPSGGGLPEAGLQRNFQDSAESREAFKEQFPFYERDEDGKPITSEFVKYDLSGYDLSGINLQGALFSVSTLKRANLEEANLENSIAYATHFEEANLKNTNFRNAVLSKSFFMATDIDGADFTGAIIDDSQREDLCSRASGINSKTGIDTYESLDCLSLNIRSRK